MTTASGKSLERKSSLSVLMEWRIPKEKRTKRGRSPLKGWTEAIRTIPLKGWMEPRETSPLKGWMEARETSPLKE